MSTVFQVIKMSEDDTTSSSRIFVKIMMQKVVENMSLFTLQERFGDPKIKALCTSMFSLDYPKKHAVLFYQLLYEHRTLYPYGRHARASQGEPTIERFVLYQS
jgi:hypothetical protein